LNGLSDLAAKHDEYAKIMEKRGDTERLLALEDIASRARAMEQKYFDEVMKLGPDDPAVLEYRFVRALNEGDTAEADRIVERIRATSAEEADALFYEGRKLVHLGEFSAAIDLIERAIELKPISSMGWRGLGLCYRQVGRLADAERAYNEAYSRKPDDLSIIREYSSLLLQMGKPTQALAILEDALRLMPDDIALREAYYQAKSSSGQTTDVLALRRGLVKSNPDDTDNLVSLVQMLGEIRPTPALIINPNTGRPFTSPQWASMRPEDRQKLTQKAQEQLDVEAEGMIKLLRDQLGDTLRMAVIHANYYRARGRVNEGLELLQDFVASDPASATDTRGARALASYLRDINRPDRAVLVLLDARDRQDDEQREIDLAIGNLAFEVRQYDTAVRHLELATENRPSHTLDLRIVDALSRLGNFDEADAKLKETLGDQPYDFVALMLAAQIADGRGSLAAANGNDAEAKKQFESYRANIEAAQRIQPSNPVPQLSLAEFLLRQFQRTGETQRLNEALSALDRVDTIEPNRSDTRITRSNIYLARGDTRAAVNELQAAVDDDPSNVNVRRSLTQLQVFAGDARAALQTVQDAIEQDPTVAFWHRRAGEIFITQMREYEKGADAFNEAYKLTGSDDDLHATIDALLQMDRPPHARILSLIDSQETPIEQNLRLMPRKAQALYIARRRDEARAMLRTAFEAIMASTPEDSGPTIELNTWFSALQRIYPEGEEADAQGLIMDMTGGKPDGNVMWLLGRFFGARGDVTRAEDLVRTAIEQTPNHRKEYRIRQYLDLGGFIVSQERWEDAIRTYEKVLELEPDNVTCLNNIAYMYAEQLGTPDKGLPFAQRAVAIAPRNADYLDTLGWTYFRLDQLKEAEEALLRSVNARPTASAYLHLGWIYLRQGDPQRARTNAERARELSPDPIAMMEIEKLEKELGSR
ncbi:MAG: tetratricopeptide repeat protein, partial [Phycisphaerales bacterium]|nr:tetratricopeptide repeat protein [Phycisphaerales bacterium]